MSNRLGRSWRACDALYVARALGLTANLQLALDPGAAASYGGSGQSSLDLSGHGYDFWRGTTSASEASDPTFNGTAGHVSSGEYWSFDGGDWFTYDSANETFMEAVHKDNALATLAWWAYPTGTGLNEMVGTNGNGLSNVGFNILVNPGTAAMRVRIANGSGTAALDVSNTGMGTVADKWQFFAASIDEAANTLLLRRNNTTASSAGAYTSPSASAATYPFRLGCSGNTAGGLPAGARIGPFWMWSAALPQAALAAIFNATRGRFGV